MAENEQPLALSPLLSELHPLFAGQEMPIYLVGGAVRDALLGVESGDLDFAVPERAVALAFAVGDALSLPAYVLDRDRDTGRVVVPATARRGKTTLDFARYRAAGLDGDLRARDFTINAMALPAGASDAGAIVDPLDGRADLQAGIVRLASPTALHDDAVRTLRAVRMAVRFGFDLAPGMADAIATAVPGLAAISAERVRDELIKLFSSPAPGQALQLLQETGLLRVVLPEIAALEDVEQSAPHHEAVLAHTISTLHWLALVEGALAEGCDHDGAIGEVQRQLEPYASALRSHLERPVDGDLSGLDLLRLGALFHDAGKAETQQREEGGRIRFFGHAEAGARLASHRLRQLRFSRQAVDHVHDMVREHMRPLFLAQTDKVTRRAVYRFFRDAGSAGLDVSLLTLADHLATHNGPGAGDAWEQLLSVTGTLFHHYFEGYDETIRPSPLLSGGELIAALGLQPGPEVGRLLRLLEEAQAAGEISSTAEALELARRARRV
jgi:poly(A) polymerase